jgi:spore coat protein CotF
LGKERLIAEVNSAEEARKVEETVKTGYLETTIDTMVNWIGVEDDLANSYEGLASKAQTPAAREVYRRLCDESRKNIEQLSELQRSLEGLDKARVQRLKLLASLKS